MTTASAYLKKIKQERRKKEKSISSDELIQNNKVVWSSVAYQQELAKKFLPHRAYSKGRIGKKSRRENLSIAQKLGIAKAPEPKLTSNEWSSVKEKAMERQHHHAPCSICMEPFGLRKQVILNCSHVFHHTCLKSYEQYVAKNTSKKRPEDRECPICRKKDYQKSTKISDGIQVTRETAAITIQCAYRVHCARKYYQKLYHAQYPEARRAFLSRKLSKLGTTLEKQQQDKSSFLDQFLNSLDASVAKSRLLLLDDNDWHLIVRSAQHKYRDEYQHSKEVCCPICMQHCENSIVVTSCGHLFHQTCLTSFESFQPHQKAHPCPVCRQTYRHHPFSPPPLFQTTL